MSTVYQPLLHVIRGKSRFPLRTIDTERFLIGVSSACQMRLSAADIPLVYAVLTPLAEACQIEALYSVPALMVNGKQKQSATLLPGDRISFGDYEFEFLIQPFEQEQPAPLSRHPQSPALVIPELPANFEELSVEELVDRIALELELLEQFGGYDDPLIAVMPQNESAPHLPRKSA